MTHAESLERLAHWAEWGASWYDAPLDGMDEAQRHGLAAVRAIRSRRIDESASCRAVVDLWVRDQAVLAFRSALNAVGLKTL